LRTRIPACRMRERPLQSDSRIRAETASPVLIPSAPTVTAQSPPRCESRPWLFLLSEWATERRAPGASSQKMPCPNCTGYVFGALGVFGQDGDVKQGQGLLSGLQRTCEQLSPLLCEFPQVYFLRCSHDLASHPGMGILECSGR
jgi:hypothetical protein